MLKNLSTIFLLILWPIARVGAFPNPVIRPTFLSWLNNTSNAYEVSLQDGRKTYYLKTDAPLRDNVPASKEVKIEEPKHLPYTRTQSTLFDSLFALAMQEVVQSSVSSISDQAFETAKCDCFETGEKWRYVWTRDTAYATDLSLAFLDPWRSMNSLSFKISGFRTDQFQGEQIVQDTGSGGSWPVSTDRVVWTLGAYETLKHLQYQSTTYQSFFRRSFEALKNTALNDRFAVYDAEDGLYTGEQSFLDWREQSNPEWTASKVVHIGMSKSLSTNVGHYLALKRLGEIAEVLGNKQQAQTFSQWAVDLKKAINKEFWDGKSYRSLKSTFLGARTSKYYDLLGISLAILSRVANPEQGASALNTYPQTQVGAPVIWPQRQEIPIYHNRAIWPFVSAYALKAAKQVGDPSLISAFIRSLMIGPAQNLSHMENYEFTTLRNYYADGPLSGPTVNSRRQLWSVAGYAGMVLDVIFGKETDFNAIRFIPALTTSVRRDLFPLSQRLELNNLKFQERKLRVVLKLPENQEVPPGQDALYTVASVSLNGKNISTKAWIKASDLNSSTVNEIEIILSPAKTFTRSKIITVGSDHHQNLSEDERQFIFAPRTPNLIPVGLSDNWPLISFHSADHNDVTYHIFKNGKLIQKTDRTYHLDLGHEFTETACYTVSAVYPSGNESFPSEPQCYWPTSSIQHYPVYGPHVRTEGRAQFGSSSPRLYFREWGGPDQKLYLENVTPARTGVFAIQLDYTNVEAINTGITSGVKKVTVQDDKTGKVIKQGIFMLPHHQGPWHDSNFVKMNLRSDTSYTVLIEDFHNMSYFNHFESYRYRGGRNGPYNRFNFAEIKFLYLGAEVE